MKDRTNTNPHILEVSLKRNRYFPNNELPVLIYRQALELPRQKNKAATIIQKIFLSHGWSNSWKNGIYDFHHYHSNTHECLGIASGSAYVMLGGPNGRRLKLSMGDVIIFPAGVGHKCLVAERDFVCVGAYPQGKDYDINTGTAEEYEKAVGRIRKLALPKHDPVFGKQGFLKAYWKKDK